MPGAGDVVDRTLHFWCKRFWPIQWRVALASLSAPSACPRRRTAFAGRPGQRFLQLVPAVLIAVIPKWSGDAVPVRAVADEIRESAKVSAHSIGPVPWRGRMAQQRPEGRAHARARHCGEPVSARETELKGELGAQRVRRVVVEVMSACEIMVPHMVSDVGGSKANLEPRRRSTTLRPLVAKGSSAEPSWNRPKKKGPQRRSAERWGLAPGDCSARSSAEAARRLYRASSPLLPHERPPRQHPLRAGRPADERSALHALRVAW